jgi:hypothetical protein
LKPRGSALAAFVLCLASAPVLACPCSDDAGGALGLTRRDERAAFGVVASARRSRGRFDALGHYSPLQAGESEWSEELLARSALRWPARVEWLAELGFASYHFDAPGISEQRAGMGDALLRARVIAVDESMPHAAFRPALAVGALVRAPLGELSPRQGASYGSGGVQLGLGAWEAGFGCDVSRSVTPGLSLGLATEAGYRFEDHALGRARRLGPRVEASLSAALALTSYLTTAASVRLRLVGDVTLDGRSLPATGERLWTLAASAQLADPAGRLRSSFTVAVDPPVSGMAVGAAAAASASVGLTYALN